MELTTPALLFPAISLLMLAYTNRFVVLSHKGSVVQFKKKNCDYQKYADICFFQSHVFGGYCFWNQFVAFVDFVGIVKRF